MEFIDAKIWISKNVSLCQVFANRVTYHVYMTKHLMGKLSWFSKIFANCECFTFENDLLRIPITYVAILLKLSLATVYDTWNMR